MKKNTYSIILTESVVQAIDRMAAQKGTSRSNLINQILAEAVSCKTPEKQMASIFAVMEEQMRELFRVQMQASDAMLSLHSALQYKYRPTLRYRVELMRVPTEQVMGYLKISCRTQNQNLLHVMQEFFRFWIALELEQHPEYQSIPNMYTLMENGLQRLLLRKQMQTEKEIGTAISLYIQQFDQLIKQYFAGLQNGIPWEHLQTMLYSEYRKWLAMNHNQSI